MKIHSASESLYMITHVHCIGQQCLEQFNWLACHT